jgi:competence protein ComEC
MPGRWGETPFAVLAPTLLLGIAAAWGLQSYSFAGLAAGTLLLILAAWMALNHDRTRTSLALGLAGIFCVGVLLSLAQRDAIAETDLQKLVARRAVPLREMLSFDGCVAEETVRRGEDLRTLVQLRGLQVDGQWLPCKGKTLLRLASGSAPPDLMALVLPLSPGDRIRGWARWDIPRNFQNPGSIDYAGIMQRQGIRLTGRLRSARLLEVLPGDCKTLSEGPAQAARRRMAQALEGLAERGLRRHAAVLSCILLGDDSRLDARTREAFQNSGVYHVLVVSGLHIGWLCWLVSRFLHLAGVPSRATGILSALAVLFYSQIVGFQASVSRCLWMFALYLAGRSAFRNSSPVNVVLASAFLLVAWSPGWASDVGFQLSFVSVLAIALTAAPGIRDVVQAMFGPLQHCGNPQRVFPEPGRWPRHGRRWRAQCEIFAEACADRCGAVWGLLLIRCSRVAAHLCLWGGSGLAVSLAVQLWLTPLTAYYFNRLSWVVPLANLAAVPLSSLALASALIAAPVAGLLLPLDWAYGPAIWLASQLCRAVDLFSDVPSGWQRCPTPPLAWVLSGILLLAAWSFLGWRRKWIPAGLVLVELACLAAGSFAPLQLSRQKSVTPSKPGSDQMSAGGRLEMTFLDVGQGDCTVIRLPDGGVWIVDAGGTPEGAQPDDSSRAFDIGEAVVSRYLWYRWFHSVDRLLASHAHSDHIGGMPALLRNFPIARFSWASAPAHPAVLPLLELARSRRVIQQPLFSPWVESADRVSIEVLHPPLSWRQRSPNEDSLVLCLKYGRFAALLTGDLEGAGERQLLLRPSDLRCALLKVPHHGSRTAASATFLRRVRPRWAVVSVGRNNPFGNPSAETLMRLIKAGARPLLTSELGAVTFATDGKNYGLWSYRCGLLEAGSLPPPIL